MESKISHFGPYISNFDTFCDIFTRFCVTSTFDLRNLSLTKNLGLVKKGSGETGVGRDVFLTMIYGCFWQG